MSKQKREDERAEELLKVISDIEEEMIAEAGFEKKNIEPMKKKSTSAKKWLPVAACFAILVIALIPLISNQFGKKDLAYNEVPENAADIATEDSVQLKDKYETAGNDTLKSVQSNDAEETDNGVYAAIDSYSFTHDDPWINVMISNGTGEAITVIPKFDIVRIGDNDAVESIVLNEDEITWPAVRYTVEADENFLQVYRLNRSTYDISKPGHYRMYLYIAEQEEPITFFDFQLS